MGLVTPQAAHPILCDAAPSANAAGPWSVACRPGATCASARRPSASRERERLRHSQRCALGSWELTAAGRLLWSDESTASSAPSPRHQPQLRGLPAAVHPDDRAAVDSAYTASLREGGAATRSSTHRAPLHREVLRPPEVRHVPTSRGGFALAGLVHDRHRAPEARSAQRESRPRKSDFLAVLSHELRNPWRPSAASCSSLERPRPGVPRPAAPRRSSGACGPTWRAWGRPAGRDRNSRVKIRLKREGWSWRARSARRRGPPRVFERLGVALEEAAPASRSPATRPTRLTQAVGKPVEQPGEVLAAAAASPCAPGAVGPAVVEVGGRRRGHPGGARQALRALHQAAQTLERSQGRAGQGWPWSRDRAAARRQRPRAQRGPARGRASS
jgi:hypothetical protein